MCVCCRLLALGIGHIAMNQLFTEIMHKFIKFFSRPHLVENNIDLSASRSVSMSVSASMSVDTGT